MKRILINPELCNGCKNCQLACMAEHSATGSVLALDLEDPASQARNFIEAGAGGRPAPLICRHCASPECVEACVSGALTRNPDTGTVVIAPEKCAGCWMCVMSCPFGMIESKIDSWNKELQKNIESHIRAVNEHFFIRVDLDEMNKIIEQRQILRTLPVNEFLTASLDVSTSYRSVGMENGRLVMENGSAASIAVTAVLANGANRAWVMKNSPGSERSLIMTSLALIETAV